MPPSIALAARPRAASTLCVLSRYVVEGSMYSLSGIPVKELGSGKQTFRLHALMYPRRPPGVSLRGAGASQGLARGLRDARAEAFQT